MATIYESCGCSEGDITIGFTKKFGMCPLHAAAPALCKVVREAALLCMLISDGVNPHSWHAAQIYGRARAALALVDTTSRIG